MNMSFKRWIELLAGMPVKHSFRFERFEEDKYRVISLDENDNITEIREASGQHLKQMMGAIV